MGSLVHSREFGKSTAVSVISFHPDLATKFENMGPGAFACGFLFCNDVYIFTAVEGARTYSYHFFLVGHTYVASQQQCRIGSVALPLLYPKTQ